MKVIEQRLPREFDKSFTVFCEKGNFFPCPWHYHPEFEFVLVTKSTGRRMVGDHIDFFEEGDLVFLGPWLPHVWVNDPEYLYGKSNRKAEAIVIHFTDNFLGDRFLSIPETEPFKKVMDIANRGMVIKGQTKNEINSMLERMLSQSGLQRIASMITIFDVLSHSSEYELLASPTFEFNSKSASSSNLNKINEYIMRNFHNDISLPEIASIANMALTTFCNFFKENYRVTFVEYLTTVRIGHACKLLAEQDLNIVQTAYECGYNNLANFNRQFRKLKGMTPSEYRKTIAS
jgi:AraC-like DNA-binding protein